MAERLFPDRRRCKSCAKGLGAAGDPVLFGLYCSPRCAGLAQLHEDAQSAPRECRTQRDGAWVFKRRYRSHSEVPERTRADATGDLYWCNHCGHLHYGHNRIDLAEEFRMLAEPKDLADVLVKLRGAATRKEVAAVAGVRPIRLKELEEPGTAERIDLDALFKVLKVLRARPGVALRPPRRR